MKNFTPTHSDSDQAVYTRELLGRITKDRFKRLTSFARRNTKRVNCGCEHDCCGHLCGQSVEIMVTNGRALVTLTQSFNC